MARGIQYFTVSGTEEIDLSTGPVVTTELIDVYGREGFSIEPIEAEGLDGVPTWTLKSSNAKSLNGLKDHDPNFIKDKGLEVGVKTSDRAKVNYFAIEVTNNGNTSGTVKFALVLGDTNTITRDGSI